jgi:hypothetical protein
MEGFSEHRDIDLIISDAVMLRLSGPQAKERIRVSARICLAFSSVATAKRSVESILREAWKFPVSEARRLSPPGHESPGIIEQGGFGGQIELIERGRENGQREDPVVERISLSL